MDLPPELLDEILRYLKLKEVTICYNTSPMFHVLSTPYLKQLLKSRKQHIELDNTVFSHTHAILVKKIKRAERVGYDETKVWLKRNRAGEPSEIRGLKGRKPYLWRWRDAPMAIKRIVWYHYKDAEWIMWIPSAIKAGYTGRQSWIPAIEWLEATRYHHRRFSDGTLRARVPFNRALFKNKNDLSRRDIIAAGLNKDYGGYEDDNIIELKSRQVIYYK